MTSDSLRLAPAREAAAGAVPYLKLAGTVIAGWLMARAAGAATTQLAPGCGSCSPGDCDFLNAKRITALHYALHVLPHASALRDTVSHGAITAFGLTEAQF